MKAREGGKKLASERGESPGIRKSDNAKRREEERRGDEIEIKIYAGKEPKNEGTKERKEERRNGTERRDWNWRRRQEDTGQDAFTIAPARSRP